MPIWPCPKKWDYETRWGATYFLQRRLKRVLLDLLTWRHASPVDLSDTRSFHTNFLRWLTPVFFPYFAGHYRGERLRCLEGVRVKIGSDPLVGHDPALVPDEMRVLVAKIATAISRLDALASSTPSPLFPLQVVKVACAAFVDLLTIHPYVNGNGHAARFLLWSILARYSLWPVNFPVHPRPDDPPYSRAVYEFRRNQPDRLLLQVMQSLQTRP
jgi:Fic family protein